MHDGGTLWRYLWRLTFSEKAVCDDEHPPTFKGFTMGADGVDGCIGRNEVATHTSGDRISPYKCLSLCFASNACVSAEMRVVRGVKLDFDPSSKAYLEHCVLSSTCTNHRAAAEAVDVGADDTFWYKTASSNVPGYNLNAGITCAGGDDQGDDYDSVSKLGRSAPPPPSRGGDKYDYYDYGYDDDAYRSGPPSVKVAPPPPARSRPASPPPPRRVSSPPPNGPASPPPPPTGKVARRRTLAECAAACDADATCVSFSVHEPDSTKVSMGSSDDVSSCTLSTSCDHAQSLIETPPRDRDHWYMYHKA